ncbi:hypothetical protein, partial [Pseudomonas savastanoi]|uniref:hypothetical protein n=1 Tax=Pseudomonas savastanoi TaxID=29438 RepID=UPI003F73F05B
GANRSYSTGRSRSNLLSATHRVCPGGMTQTKGSPRNPGRFRALGGVPRRGIYDNMKTAVDKVNKGKGRTVNARFSVMCAHYL